MAIEYAFKCANCGALEPPSAAGELDRPAKCHVCGKGAHFDTDTGVRILDPDNWIVLADLKGKDLKDLHDFHKFDPDVHVIVAHNPSAPDTALGREPVSIELSAEDGIGSDDLGEAVK